MRRTLLVTVACVLLLAGCTSGDADPSDGSADSPGSSAAPDAPTGPSSPAGGSPGGDSSPECSSVWVAGQRLPADYSTCQEGEGTGLQDVVPCADGASLIVFDDRLYAVTGQEIREPADAPLQDTDEYGAAYADCTGE